MKPMIKNFQRFINENLQNEYSEWQDNQFEKPTIENTALGFMIGHGEAVQLTNVLTGDTTVMYPESEENAPAFDDETGESGEPEEWWKFYVMHLDKVQCSYLYFLDDEVLLDSEGNKIDDYDIGLKDELMNAWKKL